MGKITKFKSSEISSLLEEYDILRNQEKHIKSRMTTLSDLIKAYAEENGEISNGSYYMEVGNYQIGKVARKSISFDEEKAIQFFKDNDLEDCVVLKEVINDEAVEEYVNNGTLTRSDLDDITKVKVSYSVLVKAKEEITDEVEETSLKVASKKKQFKTLKRK